jgi:hypothetical protein
MVIMDRVRRSPVRVRRSSVRVRHSSVRMLRSSDRVRRSSVGNASACCKAGPSSILGSAPHVGSFFSLAERRSDKDTRRQASAMIVKNYI